jgi:hypothetical protein
MDEALLILLPTIMFRKRRFDTMHGVVAPSKYAMAPCMAVLTFACGVSLQSGDKIFRAELI